MEWNRKNVEKYDREVLTLHLLTITLRRILNPPGFSQI
jgi:CO dehydrogenase/acetyl-CoA synthase delta subunit